MNDFKTLYEQGLNDVQISKLLGKSAETIRQIRLKLNLAKNFSYDSRIRIKKDILERLIWEGKLDSEIAIELGFSKDSIYAARKRYKIDRPAYNIGKAITPTQRQLEILTGCLLGDGSFDLQKHALNPRFKCEHSDKQEDYTTWKYEELESLNLSFRRNTRLANSYGNIHKSVTIASKANPEFLSLYHSLYDKKVKVITSEFLKNYTDLSLAVHFMDDGTKADCSYSMATMCFSKEDLEVFRSHLKTNFNLDFTIQKSGGIYFPAKFRTLFNHYVEKHMHPSMKYKLIVS